MHDPNRMPCVQCQRRSDSRHYRVGGCHRGVMLLPWHWLRRTRIVHARCPNKHSKLSKSNNSFTTSCGQTGVVVRPHIFSRCCLGTRWF